MNIQLNKKAQLSNTTLCPKQAEWLFEKPLEEEGIISALVNQVSARKRSPAHGPGTAAPLALKSQTGGLGGWFRQKTLVQIHGT